MSNAALTRLALARSALVKASDAVGLPQRDLQQARRLTLSTGLAGLDAALAGGLPRGQLVELIGHHSSGRMALSLKLLTEATREGEPVALVDVPDALDPQDLDPETRKRVLWVRPEGVLPALQAVDLLLDGGGFSMVALYLVGLMVPRRAPGVVSLARIAPTAWARLVRRAESTQTTLLAITDGSPAWCPGAFASVALTVKRRRVHWLGGRNLLDGVLSEVSITRQRNRPAGGPPIAWGQPR
ncbi:MAG: hypothetical protein JNK72_12990 [Myxococcales bacterium]|nr:hypothetical protein [Myxococcales bacterium]